MEQQNELYPKVFTWLFVGLLITFTSGYILSTNLILAAQVLSIGFIPIVIIELVIALVLGLRIQKMNPLTAKILYIVYSIITGITFSSIFITYELSSLMSIFLITALTFAALAFYGYTTKKDLSRWGVILLICLLVTIIASILNYFIFKSSTTDIALSGFGVLIFCGYIAYDMQKVKSMLPALGEEKASIIGAFELYLDFINLFIRLIELFGKEKD